MRMTHFCSRKTILLGILCCVCGCGPLLGSKRADKLFFVLTDDGNTPRIESGKIDSRLLVRDTRANRFVNSHKIIFSENASTRGYYQLAHWVEPPPDRFTLLLVERLERAGVFHTVSRLASSALGDLQLNTEIVEFYHDISSSPGDVVVEVSAELIDLSSREVLGSKMFVKRVEVESYSSEGAVLALSKGTNEVLDQIVVWVAQVANR